MKKIIINKIGYIAIIIIGVSIFTFGLGRLAPGDPVLTILVGIDKPMTPEMINEAREKLGLNTNVFNQYIIWIKNILSGDFGISIKTGQPVLEEILIRVRPTIELAVASIIVMTTISFPLGIISAIYKDKIPDIIIKSINIINLSLPAFCIGIILIEILGIKLKILPIVGRDGIKSLILPALTLGISMSGGLIRLIRNEISKNMKKDHVYAAKVLGVNKKSILINNIIMNSMVAIITNIGIYIGAILGGSTIIESLFGWPGMGNYIIQAIFNRDYAVIQAYAIIMAMVYVSINFIVDIICYLIDQRMRGAVYED